LSKVKKFIYLISPNKINNDNFFYYLKEIFKTKKISYFQLRLKNETSKKVIKYGKKIKKLCKRYKVKLIVNDFPLLAKKLNADGCHIGQSDISFFRARKILGNKIIGITCHNSIIITKKAINHGADYIALGAFYTTNTKKVKFKAKINTLKKVKSFTKTPIVAIGGINFSNYKKLLLNKANFLAISGYIWNNKKLNPLEATKKLK